MRITIPVVSYAYHFFDPIDFGIYWDYFSSKYSLSKEAASEKFSFWLDVFVHNATIFYGQQLRQHSQFIKLAFFKAYGLSESYEFETGEFISYDFEEWLEINNLEHYSLIVDAKIKRVRELYSHNRNHSFTKEVGGNWLRELQLESSRNVPSKQEANRLHSK